VEGAERQNVAVELHGYSVDVNAAAVSFLLQAVLLLNSRDGCSDKRPTQQRIEVTNTSLLLLFFSG